MDRTLGMGSTDVVEVCGLAPWSGAGPWRVYNRKTGVTKDDDPTDEMKWGHCVEDYLRVWYSGTFGKDVRKIGPSFSKVHPWLWASPDGRAYERIGTPMPPVIFNDGREDVFWHDAATDDYYEIKNVGSFMAHHWDLADDDGIPHYVRAQVTIGMYCAEVDHWTVIATVGGLPPRVWTVQYDAKLAQMLVDTGRAHWERIQRRDSTPPLDASDECRKYLQHVWPKDERPMIESTYADDEIASERAETAAAVKNGKARIKALDHRLLARIQDAKGIYGEGWKMTTWVDGKGRRQSRFTAKGEEGEE